MSQINRGYIYYVDFDFSDPIDSDMLNESTMKAVFGEVSYDLLDGDLTLLVGGRWYEEERSAIGYGLDEDTGEKVLQGTTEKDFDDFTPRFNVAYYPTENGMVYVNVAKGTRSGLVNLCEDDADDNPANGCQFQGLVDAGYTRDTQIIDEDSMWSYELGTKWLLLDSSLVLMGSLYYSQWTDFQGEIVFRGEIATDYESLECYDDAWNWVLENCPVTAYGGSSFANVGDVDLWGAQLQVSWQLTDSISIDWSGSWNSGEWGDTLHNPDGGIVASQGAREGEEIVGSAEWTSNLSVSYNTAIGAYDLFASATWSVDDILTGFPEPVIGWDTAPAVIVPTSLDNGTAIEAVDNREDISLNIGVSRGRWTALLYVDNLLNADDPVDGGSKADPAHGYVPVPLTIGLRVSVDFGAGSKSMVGSDARIGK